MLIEKTQYFGNVKKYLENVNLNLDIEKLKIDIENAIKKYNLSTLKVIEFSSYFHSFYDLLNTTIKAKDYTFFCENSFKALVSLQKTISNNNNNVSSGNVNMNIQIYNGKIASIDKDFIENFTLSISIFGLSFENIYNYNKNILSTLKPNSFFVLYVPSFWFGRENLTDLEKTILSYCKKTDKKWMFIEPFEKTVEENKAKIIENSKTDIKVITDRYTLSILSSLENLTKAEINKDRSVIELCEIPENNVEIYLNRLIIEKKEKTLTADNLFKI